MHIGGYSAEGERVNVENFIYIPQKRQNVDKIRNEDVTYDMQKECGSK